MRNYNTVIIYQNLKKIMQPKQPQPEKPDFITKRQQFTIGIRKQKRQQLLTRRRAQASTSPQQSKIILSVDPRFQPHITKFHSTRFHLQSLPQLIKSITSQDLLQQHYGVIGIRKIMSLVEQPPIQVIIDAGLIPRLIEFVSQDEYPQLQLEATWTLVNVASGSPEHCDSIINKEGVRLFVRLLKSEFAGIVEQAIWVLGNIASDSTFHRDAIIRQGGVTNLVFAIEKYRGKITQLIQPGIWALSNLCRGTPLPNYEMIKQGVFCIADVLAKETIKDQGIFADCCWSLSYNFPTKSQQYKKIISQQFITTMKHKLMTQDFSIVVPIIRIFGHITKISHDQVTKILSHPQILATLTDLLEYDKKVVRLETCWVLSNISCGPQSHINILLQNQLLISKLLQHFQIDADDVKRQIVFIFSNMTILGQPAIIYRFFKSVNIIRYYAKLLTSDDDKLVENGLEGMYSVLELGEKFKEEGHGQGKGQGNVFVRGLEELGVLGVIQDLQEHRSQNVYVGVVKIMMEFFEMDDGLAL